MVQLFCNETKEWYHVFVNGEEIVCTGGHPFYVVGEGFVEVKDLKISDKLLLSSGKCVTIEEIQVEQLSESETTYNFEVADFHTYYVSESNVLVHNMCAKSNSPQSPKKLKDQYLKKNNIDSHEFKKSILGKKAQISRYDIYLDTVDDSLWLGTKSKGAMQWIETFETISSLIL